MGTAINLRRMKQTNKRLILDAVRSSSVSRAELAKFLRLTRASVTQNVDELLTEELVIETGTTIGPVGRRPILLSLNKDARYFFGVNILRNGVNVGIVNFCGEMLANTHILHGGNAPSVTLGRIADILKEQQHALNIPSDKLLGVGVCAPGPLDYKTGTILNPPNFSSWHNTAVGAILSEALKMPVKLENISSTLTLCEKYYGCARESSNIMVMLVTEGIGAGLLIGDRLYRGFRGLGGELGHTVIAHGGRPCACGNAGCLEVYASIPRILEGSEFTSWKELVDAYPDDPEAEELLSREAAYLSTAIINTMNMFDLEKIVLTGDVTYNPDPLLDVVNEIVSGHALVTSGIRDSVVCGSVFDPILTGAMSLINAYFTNTI